MKVNNKITPTQRGALHLWFRLVADALDEIGFDMRDIKVAIPPTEENVKGVYRQVMHNMYPGKESTEELTPSQVVDCYDVLNRGLSTSLGISVPFPTEEEYKKYLKQKRTSHE